MASGLIHALLNINSDMTPSRDVSTVLRLPTADAITLSPLDIHNRGRAIPLLWYYKETLDVDKLKASLVTTLEAFPVLCGRYNDTANSICLNNAGVPFEVIYTTDTFESMTEHLKDTAGPEDRTTNPSTYNKDTQEKLLPTAKSQMDPDAATPDVPMLAVKVTVLTQGTVIGILIQHGLVDAEAALFFMRSWSRVFLDQPLSGDSAPDHDRTFALNSQTTDTPARERFAVVPFGEIRVPEFAAHMPRLTGPKACILPLTRNRLVEMKESASEGLPPHRFISTDDVITARVWKAFVRARVEHLSVSADSDKPTTLMRALNVRTRLDPPLKGNVFANAVTTVPTVLTVKQVTTMTVSQLALRLRSSLQKWTPGKIVATMKWMKQQQSGGDTTVLTFDSNALTFVVSSWVFPLINWEDVDFGTKAAYFEHRCHVPFVCVYTSRPGRDGVNVWTSGRPEALVTFLKVVNAD